MLTPQDVQNQEFPKAVFGGYDMSAVDNFLETMTEDYAGLYKENAKLKSKLKVLVEKVEEYRSTEDSMRMALLTAQKMGDDLLEEANRKSAAMLSDADAAYRKRSEEIAAALAEEEARLDAAKSATAEYVRRVGELMRDHAEYLSQLDKLNITEKKDETPAPEEQTGEKPESIKPVSSVTFEEQTEEEPSLTESEEEAIRQITETMRKIADEEPDTAKNEAEPTAGPAPEEAHKAESETQQNVTPRPKFNFENLQFGTNYNPDDDK